MAIIFKYLDVTTDVRGHLFQLLKGIRRQTSNFFVEN